MDAVARKLPFVAAMLLVGCSASTAGLAPLEWQKVAGPGPGGSVLGLRGEPQRLPRARERRRARSGLLPQAREGVERLEMVAVAFAERLDQCQLARAAEARAGRAG